MVNNYVLVLPHSGEKGHSSLTGIDDFKDGVTLQHTLEEQEAY